MSPQVRFLGLSLWIACTATGTQAASSLPMVPCGSGDSMAVPASPPSPPRAEAWTNFAWNPPACLPWEPGTYRYVSIIAGAIRITDSGELLARLGAVSTTAGMRYWSEPEGKWRVQVEDATALDGQGGPTRGDFTKEEMRPDAVLYFRDKDDWATRPVTYRMQVLKASDDEVIVESTNVTTVAALGFTLVPPGSFHLAHIARRGPGDQWTLHLVSAADGRASWMLALGKESHVHRAMAVFVHVAGLPQK